jgi:hypothetical protein
MVKEDLIRITPLEQTPDCPTCGGNGIEPVILFQGIHTLVKSKCNNCNVHFFQTLPVGHDLLFPMTFIERDKKIVTKERAKWLSQPLVKALFEGACVRLKVSRDIHSQKSEAIILNCLDNCFGHVFAKLWNASILQEKYPDQSIIVFIPASMRWLIPAGISEIWAFDHSLSELDKFLTGLDEEVKQNLLPRFENVWMSKAYTHLDLARVDLKAMLRTDRFDLASFDITPTTITFVVREDRFWHSSAFEFFLFKVFVKLRLSKNIFVWRQNNLISRLADLIKKELGNARFHATGLGKSGRLSSLITDKRKINLTKEDELEWCDIYSKSHVVIGVHGSNMMIPTALAAGFIEVLPRHKLRHIAEDTLVNYSSRYTIFLGRHVDHFVRPRLLADHVVNIIRFFPYLYRNTEQRT